VPTDRILEEYAKQYKGYSWLQFFGLFFLPIWFIGLIMIVYAAAMKASFRRKIVEIGVDPDAWEEPLQRHARILFYSGVLMVVGVSVMVWMMWEHS
jgi:hypothetical protein